MRTVIALLFFIMAVSCDMSNKMEIDIPTPEEKLVVNCFFAADSVWTVQVYKSKNALAAKNSVEDRVTNATVVIDDGTKEIPFELDDNYFLYRSKEAEGSAVVGKPYTLKVSAPGFDPVTSTVRIPDPVSIVDVSSTTANDILAPGHHSRIFEIHFKDPGQQVNYYALSVFGVGTSPFPPYSESVPKTTRPLNPTWAEDYYGEWYKHYRNSFAEFNLLFNDRTFDGASYVFKVATFEPDENAPHAYIISLKSLSDEYYNYRVTYNIQEQTAEDPFAQPVQVFNNIKDGYGIFAGYSQATIEHNTQE
jgi:hypothetical protein